MFQQGGGFYGAAYPLPPGVVSDYYYRGMQIGESINELVTGANSTTAPQTVAPTNGYSRRDALGLFLFVALVFVVAFALGKAA